MYRTLLIFLILIVFATIAFVFGTFYPRDTGGETDKADQSQVVTERLNQKEARFNLECLIPGGFEDELVRLSKRVSSQLSP